MAATARGWPLPEQSTSPPDVVSWVTQGLNAADADVTAAVAAIQQVNNKLAYGPVGSVPTTLPVGYLYFGYA